MDSIPVDRLLELHQRRLLPPLAEEGLSLHLVSRQDRESYRGKARGCLIGGACGDALGRPVEGKWPRAIQNHFGVIRDFRKWAGWESGPVGTITDDTQMTMCVAETLVERGWLDPEDLAGRFVEWLPVGRGKGRTCTAAVRNIMGGAPWHRAGEPSAGNGAAMRAAPIGIARCADVDTLRREAALSALVTHADRLAVASTVAMAFGVAYLLHTEPGALVRSEFLAGLVDALRDLSDPGTYERKPNLPPERLVRIRLADRIAELERLHGRSVAEVSDYLHNGAFVLESLPFALWCFLESPEDPEEVLVRAVNAGHDADTVASMAGNLAGAYMGESAFPDRWRNDLEFADELRKLADGLLAMSGIVEGVDED